MARVLAVSDEDSHLAYSGHFSDLRPDLIVACGDLRAEYLEYLVTILNKPLYFIPGNHDADARFAPGGCTNVDMRVEEVGAIRLGGLGGSHRYCPGPNQYTQEQMRSRAHRLARKSRVRGRGPRLDILLTHSPPEGVGDENDVCHRGFQAFHQLVRETSPQLLIHGHVHPYGRACADHRLGSTTVVNAVGYRLLEVTS